MRSFIIPVTILLTLTFASCNPNRIFESHYSDFPDYQWYKDKPVEFTVHIEDTVSTYRLKVALRHVYGYQFQTMKIYMDVAPPVADPVAKGYELQIMDGTDGYLSDCSGDICDLEIALENKIHFVQPGDWKFTFFCDMDLPYVPNVMEFGMIIDKREEDE